MQSFTSLKVWEKAHRLTLDVYNVSTAFPRHEQYGLVSQMRRSSSSIPTNIAEGCGRGTDLQFGQFLRIAFGSACELEYQFMLARDLKYLDEMNVSSLIAKVTEIKKMLTAFIIKLKADS